jgi:hypothetical protein
VRNGYKNPEHPARREPSLSSLAVIELIKIIMTLAAMILKRHNFRLPPILRGPSPQALWEQENISMYSEDLDDNDWPMSATSPRTIDRFREATRTWPNFKERCTLAALGALHVVHASAVSSILNYIPYFSLLKFYPYRRS